MPESELESQEERVSRRVLMKIEKEKLKMRPSFVFTAVSCLWIMTAIAVFFVAVAFFSVSIHYVDRSEPTILFFEKPFLLFTSLPYFLITGTVIFLILSAMAYRKGRCCCRHENWMLMGFLFISAFVIGFSAYNARLERSMVKMIEENPRINAFIKTPFEFWYQPERGTLSGIFIGKNENDELEIESWNGLVWRVDASEDQSSDMKKKLPIKMIGKKSGEQVFEAKRVFKW